MDPTQVMSAMDDWVKTTGNGRWADPEAPDVVTPIQMVKEEAIDLVNLIVWQRETADRPGRKWRALDIGLGEHGGSRRMFKLLFDEVVTVECDAVKVDRHGHEPTIVCGRSGVVLRSFDSGSFDFAHVDGDHSADGVAMDLDEARRVVKRGGLIAVHDLLLPGVSAALRRSRFRWLECVRSKHVGFAWRTNV